jgi:hypothetical protein
MKPACRPTKRDPESLIEGAGRVSTVAGPLYVRMPMRV